MTGPVTSGPANGVAASTVQWLGGADEATALRLTGRPLSYGALRERVARQVLAPAPGGVTSEVVPPGVRSRT